MSSTQKCTEKNTKPDNAQQTEASPPVKDSSNILTLRSTIVFVVILCFVIQNFAPSTLGFLSSFLSTDKDAALPTRTTTAPGGAGTRGSGDGGDGSSSSPWAKRSTSDRLSSPSSGDSTSPFLFGTPDPLPSSTPFWSSFTRDSVRGDKERQKRGGSPFQGFFAQSSDDTSGTPETTCSLYLCRETGACVRRPMDCPCPYELDTKCKRGDWYSCHRGPFDCNHAS